MTSLDHLEQYFRVFVWLGIFVTIFILSLRGYNQSHKQGWVWLIIFSGGEMLLTLFRFVYWEFFWSYTSSGELMGNAFSISDYLLHGCLIGAIALFVSSTSNDSSSDALE